MIKYIFTFLLFTSVALGQNLIYVLDSTGHYVPYVKAELQGPASTVPGPKGDSGYTPRKGIDYNDGLPGERGYTPIKGVDYFDGAPGTPGEQRQTVITPEDYGCVGDSLTDETTNFQAAINAVQGTGKVLFATKKYKITSGLTTTLGNWTLDGGGTGKIMLVASSGTIDILKIEPSSPNAIYGPRTKSFYPVSQRSKTTRAYMLMKYPTGVAAGQFISMLYWDGATNLFCQNGIVKSVSGDTLRIFEDIIIPLDSAYASAAGIYNTVDNFTVKGIIFDGMGSTGTSIQGINAHLTKNCTFENIKFRDIQNTPLWMHTGLNNTLHNLRSDSCGAASYAAFMMAYQTKMAATNLYTNITGGGGIEFTGCSFVNGTNLTAMNSIGNGGIFLDAIGYSNFSNLIANKFLYGGVCFAYGAYRNNVSNVSVASSGTASGIFFGNENSQFNLVSNVQASTTTGITFGATDSNNTVMGYSGSSAIINNGKNCRVDSIPGVGTQGIQGDPGIQGIQGIQGNTGTAGTNGVGFMTTTAATPATTGTMTVSMTTGFITITPTGACTFNATGGTTGNEISFIITTSGTASFTLTFGTNFRKVGTLATGTTSARYFMVTFKCINGTLWQEKCRTAAQQ
jgi:hypothetical protein